MLTWEKIRWETPAVSLTITNLFALAFVVVFLVDRMRHPRLDGARSVCHPAGFMAVFAAVFLAGYYDLQNHQALSFWAEGPGLVDGALRVPDLRRRAPRPGAVASCSWRAGSGSPADCS